MHNSIPKIEPIKTKEYAVKQSKYDNVPKLPMRSMLLGPSGSGKTMLLQNNKLNIYRGCFERIFIFSPSINIDQSWEPVRDYIEEHIKPDKDEQLYFDEYNPADLENIITTRFKVVDYMKKNNNNKLYQILVVIDDFADNPSFTRKSPLLHQLYIRGRHSAISRITSTQVYKAISPIIRKNLTAIMVYRLRNYSDLESLLEEFGAVYDKDTLLELYKIATDPPFSFLYINLMQRDKKLMFFRNFSVRLILQD